MKKFIILLLFGILCCSVCFTNVYARPVSQVEINDGGGGETSTTPEKKSNADFMSRQGYVSCGGDQPLINKIPSIIPKIASNILRIVMVAVPVILVLLGMIDLVKGLMSQKEDEIKKGRESLTKRTIMGIVVFLIVLIVKVFVNFLGGADSARIASCIDCFVNNECGTYVATTTS